ncbi:MAG TPA: hypothetical protein VMU11_04460 [Verrucomicrobiae bacterium]|nr:hypothetical protein [Verrucomicrobiae bacterium]
MIHVILVRLFFPTDSHPFLEKEMSGTFRDDGHGRQKGYLRGKSAELVLNEVVHASLGDRMHFTAYVEGMRHRIEFAFEQTPNESPFSTKETPTYWAGTFKGPEAVGEGRARAYISMVEPSFFKDTKTLEAPKAESVRFRTDHVRSPEPAPLSL